MTIQEEEGWPLIASAITAIKHAGHRAWRTHIQKLIYIAISWDIVPDKPYRFVIHQFGPYSFDLDQDISRMEAFGIIQRQWGKEGLGSHFSIEDLSYPYAESLDELAKWLSPKGVRDLEVLATVNFVRCHEPADLSKEVMRVKPHIRRDDVEKARAELDAQRELLECQVG